MTPPASLAELAEHFREKFREYVSDAESARSDGRSRRLYGKADGYRQAAETVEAMVAAQEAAGAQPQNIRES